MAAPAACATADPAPDVALFFGFGMMHTYWSRPQAHGEIESTRGHVYVRVFDSLAGATCTSTRTQTATETMM